MNVNIPVSIGELWDKYTILLIKQNKIRDSKKLTYIRLELEYLDKFINNYQYIDNVLFCELKDTNSILWDIEDKLRIKESLKIFDDEFIQLARSVYYTNDKRAELKSQINIKYSSIIHEVKEYINYSS
jgi:hypothetical protein